jgi:hypothetical protein
VKKYSEACERNRAPILEVLRRVFANSRRVLEIGSGTGQHAAYFAPELPHLVWQASDVAENLPDIREWVSDPPRSSSTPTRPGRRSRPTPVFSANTCHIMSWPQVERLFAGIGRLRPQVFALYGPFNYDGRHTSESNARFDAMLRERDPLSGIRDFEKISAWPLRRDWPWRRTNAMPANNRLLVFRRSR